MTGAIIIEGHVQGLANARALGKMGVPVYVVDNYNCIARYSKYCKKFFKCPDFTSKEFILFLINLAERENLKGWVLLPSNDQIIYNLSKNKAAISKIYKTIVPGLKTLIKIYDKYEFLTFLKNKDIPVPNTLLVNQIKNYQSIQYPVLLKGREGLAFFKATNKKGFIANTPHELEQLIYKIQKKVEKEKILVQEIIPVNDSKDIWSFSCFAINGITKTFWIGKKLREHPIKFGTATFAMSDHNEYVENYGKRIIIALKFTGVCEIEFVKDKSDGFFKLIEMNPRTWLWVDLAYHCGIDFNKYIYNYLNNIHMNYPAHYLRNIKWINIWTDLFFSFKAILKNKLTLGDYFSEMNGKIVTAVFDKKDILPFIMMTILLPYLKKKRV